MLVVILVGWPIYGEIKGYSQFLNVKLFVTCAKMYILRVLFRISPVPRLGMRMADNSENFV